MTNSHLLAQLKRFGLNPKDWLVRLETLGDRGLCSTLVHREDPEWELYGPCRVMESPHGLQLYWDVLRMGNLTCR